MSTTAFKNTQYVSCIQQAGVGHFSTERPLPESIFLFTRSKENEIYTVNLASSCCGALFLLYMTGNSIQTWMWVEKGVPGVSTCTVWQSEYPWFLICPFSHVVSLTTPTLCEVWEVSCNSFHKPYPPVSPLRKAPQKTHTCMALSGTVSWTTNPQHLMS